MTITKENKQIRFAVVMYGGGSLAIYINGIAQELFKMVRATAEDTNQDDLSDTGKVYRQLSLLLSEKELLENIAELKSKNEIRVVLEALLNKNREEFEKSLSDEKPKLFREVIENSRRRIVPAEKDDAGLLLEKAVNMALAADRAQVRFIVDVISGSSAGGINGVFLAKALVNNQPMNSLKKLWLEEGDFAKLLNDKKSITGTNLTRRFEPESLLNSQRMYAKLLAALDGMDKSRDAEEISPNLDGELDLFVTVTDYTGVKVPIRLFDRIVNERRHKQFFRFDYRNKSNNAEQLKSHNFDKAHNPFLAFAARATSAFPLAFEPMRLADIDEVIERCAAEYSDGKSSCDEWKKFFKDFDLLKDDKIASRAFLDGGALDNKPFGFAVETLLERRADVPVDRKLIYIEPSPESFNPNGDILSKPDAVENLIAQGSTLPRYETIREDLQNLLERNRFVVRVNKLVKETEKNVYESYNDPQIRKEMFKSAQSKSERKDLSRAAPGEQWEKFGFKEIVEFKGRGVLPYYHLRKIQLTDSIARPITRFFGYNDKSDYFLAIRALINGWRDREFYDERRENEPEKKTINYFLRHFDLEYRLRRLRFVLRKVEKLRTLDEELQEQLKEIWEKEKINLAENKTDAAEHELNQKEKIEIEMADGSKQYLFPGAAIWYLWHDKNMPGSEGELLAATAKIQTNLIEAYEKLRNSSERLNSFRIADIRAGNTKINEAEKSLFETLGSIEIRNDDLEYILGKLDEDGKNICTDFDEEIGLARAEQYLDTDAGQVIFQLLKEAAEKLDVYLSEILKTAYEDINRTLNLSEEADQSVFEKAICAYLRHYYENFDDYDQISFPIFYQTNIGEADVVDIIRISPHDAKSLIDEENPQERRRKLAGNALYGFGAFLDVAWRQNDIMWGRLDGAERLITAILPNETKYSTLREVLIEEAQQLILREEFLKHNSDELAVRYSDILLKMSAGLDADEAIRQTSSNIFNSGGDEMQSLINACISDKQIRAVFASRLEDQWEKRGKVFPATVAGALDDEEIRKALDKHFKSKELRHAVAALVDRASNHHLKTSVQTCISDDDAVGFMQSYYQVNRRLEPQPLLRVVSRSTQIIGKIVENISDKNGIENRQLQWIARLGSIFWGFVEVAAPNSLLNLLFQHWLKLLYFFEAILILGGTLLVKNQVQQTGILALVITLMIHVAVLFLEDTMRGRHFWRDVLKSLVVSGFVLLSISGAIFLISFVVSDDLWQRVSLLREQINELPNLIRSIPAILIGLIVLTILLWQAFTEKFRKN